MTRHFLRQYDLTCANFLVTGVCEISTTDMFLNHRVNLNLNMIGRTKRGGNLCWPLTKIISRKMSILVRNLAVLARSRSSELTTVLLKLLTTVYREMSL